MRRTAAGRGRSTTGTDGSAKSRVKRATAGSARGEDWYYRPDMTAAAPTAEPRGFARLFAWRRLRFTLIAAFLWSLLLNLGWTSSYASLLFRTLLIAIVLMLIFGLLERWPRRLPRWLARWVLQVVSIAISLPFIVADHLFPVDARRRSRFLPGQGAHGRLLRYSPARASCSPLGSRCRRCMRHISGAGAAAGAGVRARAQRARAQGARRALRLLQAQVAAALPVQHAGQRAELVESGSPQASAVLGA